MSWDHERVDELLAGYVLGGLDEEDAALAARALIEHVPECDTCRRSLEAYRLVEGDLGLAPPVIAAPETLDAAVRRVARPARRPTLRGWGVAAAAVAAIVAMTGWNALLLDRVGDAELRQEVLTDRLATTETLQRWLQDAMSSATHPKRSVVPMTGPGKTRIVLLYVPGDDRGYVIGSDLPPPEGSYVVWFSRDGETWTPGKLERLGDVALVRVETDPESWDQVMITEERASDTPTPSSSPLVVAEISR